MKIFARRRAASAIPEYATIALSRHQSAQGPVLREFGDGRIVIDSGFGEITGRRMNTEAERAIPSLWMPLFTGF